MLQKKLAFFKNSIYTSGCNSELLTFKFNFLMEEIMKNFMFKNYAKFYVLAAMFCIPGTP
jgi:hypothetical protein